MVVKIVHALYKKKSLKTISTQQPAQILRTAVDLTQIDCHLVKMGLFKISKELQLRVCSHIDHVQVLSKNMERTLKEREEVGRVIVNSPALSIG